MDVEERINRLEQRVSELETRQWNFYGRLIAMHGAIAAVAGEPDARLRPTLLEDLLNSHEATLLSQPIADAQLDRIRRGREHEHEALQHAFERALVRPEFRTPPPREPPPGRIR
jgi:hypothetical protein